MTVALDHIGRDIRFAARQLRKQSRDSPARQSSHSRWEWRRHRDFRVRRCRPDQAASVSRSFTARRSVRARRGLPSIEPVLRRLSRLEEVEHGVHVAGCVSGHRRHAERTDGVERVPAARVSDDFFRTLGVEPILGRDFGPVKISRQPSGRCS